LGSSASEVPAGLWEKIAASVGEIPLPGAPDKLSVVHPLGAVPVMRQRGSRRWQVTVWGAVAAVAAAVIAVLGAQVSHLDQQVQTLRTAVGQYGLSGAAAQVALGPHRTIVLTADKADVAKVVVGPSGTAFWVQSSLRELPSSKTYQLWGLARGNIVSLGLIGPLPDRGDHYHGDGDGRTQRGHGQTDPTGARPGRRPCGHRRLTSVG